MKAIFSILFLTSLASSVYASPMKIKTETKTYGPLSETTNLIESGHIILCKQEGNLDTAAIRIAEDLASGSISVRKSESSTQATIFTMEKPFLEVSAPSIMSEGKYGEYGYKVTICVTVSK